MNADQIKLIRAMAGLSQIEFAKMLNVDKTHLSKWERGVLKPSIKSVNKIVSLVGSDNVRRLNALVHSLTMVELQESIKRKFQNKKGEYKYEQRK
ncbi:helix-turn-helix domain-containing protein [Bacillus thuringiensis]|uniref:Helix-turn-helix transcriptional regulator n=1 Tax=Bacillus thuringiensis serovar andalousiensis TaxID=257985 RepID=A0A6H0TBR5_BACTU|nr:helix-turn-helix transcriptional regulator [Bacillus thuringiensis]QIW18312.1 helix-turn-helix transcriptional regulator [Bacillus thuringiensis serovar andalousiensis]